MKSIISSISLENAIGRRIAALRKQHGWSQSTLANELDVTIKHISECERGVATFSLERLIDLCEIFDVSLDYLVRGYPTDETSLNFPTTMIEIFRSNDSEEIALLNSYLSLYEKIHNPKTITDQKSSS